MFPVDTSAVMAAALLSVRVAAVLLLTPVLTALSMPVPVRVLLVAVLAFTMALALPEPARVAAAALGDSTRLCVAVVTEAAIGLAMALGIQVAFGAIALGGYILDVQIGYGIAQVFDPATHRQTPILTSIFNQLGIVVFLVGDFHHVLLRGLAYSIERVPPGQAWSLDAASTPVLHHAGALFALGFVLVAPVIFCLLMLEFGLAVLARNVPQIQLFSMSYAFKIVVGLMALMLWVTAAPDAMARLYKGVFLSWEALFPHG